MPYVERRDGQIVGVYAKRQPGYAEEQLPDDHPDIEAYRRPRPVNDKVTDLETAIDAVIADKDVPKSIIDFFAVLKTTLPKGTQ